MRALRTTPRDALLRYWREQLLSDELAELDKAQRLEGESPTAQDGTPAALDGLSEHDPESKTGSLGKRQSVAGAVDRVDQDQLGELLQSQDTRTAQNRRAFRKHQAHEELAAGQSAEESVERFAQRLGPAQREPQNSLLQTLADARKERVRTLHTVVKKRGSGRAYGQIPHPGALIKAQASQAIDLGPQRTTPFRRHAQDGATGAVSID